MKGELGSDGENVVHHLSGRKLSDTIHDLLFGDEAADDDEEALP